MGKAKKKERKNKKSKQKICTFKHFFIPLHSLLRDKANGDPLAQLVEHNTFNVGVLGSSPKRITWIPTESLCDPMRVTSEQNKVKEDSTSVVSSLLLIYS